MIDEYVAGFPPRPIREAGARMAKVHGNNIGRDLDSDEAQHDSAIDGTRHSDQTLEKTIMPTLGWGNDARIERLASSRQRG